MLTVEDALDVVMLTSALGSIARVMVVAVPCRYRSKYFPRTPPAISYSARISWSLLSGFICPPLLRGRLSGSDDPNDISAISMPDDHYALRYRKAGSEPPLFVCRVARIGHRRSQGVIEHRAGLSKPDAMLDEVEGIFPVIPFKSHAWWRPSDRCQPRLASQCTPQGGDTGASGTRRQPPGGRDFWAAPAFYGQGGFAGQSRWGGMGGHVGAPHPNSRAFFSSLRRTSRQRPSGSRARRARRRRLRPHRARSRE